MAHDALEAAHGLLDADARTRDIALFRVSEEVCKHLDEDYCPPPMPERPQFFRGLRGPGEVQQRLQDPLVARSFGAFRALVLEHEECCARRLTVLRSTARTLSRLADVAREPERLRAMLAALGRHVAGRWRVDLPLDDGPHLRDWALKVSRRYDVLPPSWRAL